MNAPRVFEPGDLFLGRDYRLEHKLGEGGMGQVWKATEVFSGNVVAIKILRRTTESFVARFRTECRYYTKLRHDNIVRMARAGLAEDGTLYIVMELLEGRTLRDIVNGTSKKRLPLLHALHVMIQLADAMQYVHRKGIYHRDLKPENLMVSTADETKGHLWIVDFGIATFANPHEPGALDSKELPEVGTLFYLSPEQARPGRLKPDGRADIYSFGVILYELLAGRHPFVRVDEPTTPEAILNGHLCAEIQPLHEIIEDLPPEVWDVTARCLARSVEARYQTFEEVGEALRSLMRSSLPPEHYIAKRIVREKQAKARRATFDRALGNEGDFAPREKRTPPAAGPILAKRTADLPAEYVPSTIVTPFQPVAPPSDATIAPNLPEPQSAQRSVEHEAPNTNNRGAKLDLHRSSTQDELGLDRSSIQGDVLDLDPPPVQRELIAAPDEVTSQAPVAPEPDPLDPLPEPTVSSAYAFKPVAVTDLLPTSPETPKTHTNLYAPSIEAMKALAFGAPPAREPSGPALPSSPSLPSRAETRITPPTPLTAAIAPDTLRARDRSKRAMVVAPFVGLGMAALVAMALLGARWARDRARALEPAASESVPWIRASAAPSAIEAPSAATTEAPDTMLSPVVSASAKLTPAAEMKPAPTKMTTPANKSNVLPPKVQTPTFSPNPANTPGPSPAPSATPTSGRIL